MLTLNLQKTNALKIYIFTAKIKLFSLIFSTYEWITYIKYSIQYVKFEIRILSSKYLFEKICHLWDYVCNKFDRIFSHLLGMHEGWALLLSLYLNLYLFVLRIIKKIFARESIRIWEHDSC